MRIIASLLIFLGITINAAPFSGAKREAFTAAVPASGGGDSFPSVPGIYARYTSSSWSGFANGNSIITWTNTAGPAPNLITGNAASRGYWTNNAGVSNAKPWLALPVVGNTSYTNALVTGSPFTIFMLLSYGGTPNQDRLFDYAGGNYLYSASGTGMEYSSGGVTLTVNNTAANTLYLCELTCDNSGSGTFTLYTNKVLAASDTGNFVSVATLANPWVLAYKRFGSPTYNYWEIVISTNALAGSDVTNLRNYFTTTYGVP